MEEDSVPENGSLDKSRVLNIKPLRALVPVFASQPNFASTNSAFGIPPFGPFPPEVSPIYPFVGPGGQTPISTAAPITSYRTPQPTRYTGNANGSTGIQKRGRPRKQDTEVAPPDVDTDALVNNILESQNLVEIDEVRQTDGDREVVGYVLLVFDWLRRKISRTDDSKAGNPGQLRRPDLRACTVLMNKGFRTNSKKRFGAVPGVEVGDIFFFRMELCIVGLHSPSMAGIDYMGIKISQEEELLAVSIVSSGGYEDNDDDDENVLIYSGHGGVCRRDKEAMDQKLERGNLALEKSLHRGNEVRVVRGMKDVFNPMGKVYVYDGLYKIQESWIEKGRSGNNIFKYKLVRLPGQPEAFKTWKSIQQWKDGATPRFGMILPDLTSGAEPLAVPLVNDFDNEKGPAYFTYSPSLHYPKPINVAEPSVGCSCQGGCQPSNHNCSCVQKNGRDLPYIVNGVLVERRSLIYECGTSCECPPSCRNRVSQGGLKVRLEVFKTQDKGWGLRSWDPIRAGSFICEYTGEVINSSEQELVGENEGGHFFYGNRIYQPVEGMPGDFNDAPKLPFPLIIDARDAGNVARFMNHSCSPNVFWQPVVRANSKSFDLHIVFHAIKHIPPMKELTYGYGMVSADREGRGKKKCLCGSPKCKGFFY